MRSCHVKISHHKCKKLNLLVRSGPVNEQLAAIQAQAQACCRGYRGQVGCMAIIGLAGQAQTRKAMLSCAVRYAASTNPAFSGPAQGVTVHDESILKRHEGSKSHGRAVDKEAGRFGLAKAMDFAVEFALIGHCIWIMSVFRTSGEILVFGSLLIICPDSRLPVEILRPCRPLDGRVICPSSASYQDMLWRTC